MQNLSIHPIVNPWLVTLAVVVLMAMVFIQPKHVRLKPAQTATLVLLRLLVVLMTLLVMLRPTWIYSELRPQKSSLVVLIDDSRSMQVADSIADASRYLAAKTLLADATPDLTELADKIDFKAYTFADTTRPVEMTDEGLRLPATPNGLQTALGAALEDVLQREASSRVRAILLLSDGAQRALPPRDLAPQLAARRLAAEGIPLYTFAFGKPGGSGRADLRVEDLVVSSTIFALAPTVVRANVVARGFANQFVRAQLLWENDSGDMEVVDTKQLSIGLAGEPIPIELRYVPPAPGERKIAVRVEPQEGELVTSNNQTGTFVSVRAGGINVLYLVGATRIGGGPGLEQRFVRAAIAESPDIVLQRRFFNYRQPEQDIREALGQGQLNVIVLDDVDQLALNQESWQAIADLVTHGAGLMVLGGFHSFGPGGYRELPLADVLPIEIGFAERQNFDEPLRHDVHVTSPTKMRPANPLGQRHPVMQLDSPSEEATSNDAAWNKLPPLDGLNLFDRRQLKPNALVLAESDDENQYPLLVAGQPGAGRSLAFAGDSTWRWPMHGFGAEHRRFWRQCILWLAKKDRPTDSRAWIRLATRRVKQGGRLDLVCGANDPQFMPISTARIDVEVETPDGARLTLKTRRKGSNWSASFRDTLEPGDYVVHVVAYEGDDQLGTAKARFLVPQQDLELDRPASDPGLLAQLSQLTSETGGASLAPEQLPVLLADLARQPPVFKKEVLAKITYWDTWPFLLLFVALLTAEWYLRKRWGLV